MFFWNSLAFLIIQQMLAIWSLVPLPFLNQTWTSGSSQFTYYWSLAWRILSITLLPECSCFVVWTFFGIALVRLKILQARLQQYVNHELPDVQAGFRKGRGTRDQIANIHWIIEKAREFQKNIDFCFIDYVKDLTMWITVNRGKLKEMGIPDHLTCLLRNLYAGQEVTVKTGHGTTNWFQIGKGVRQGCILSPCLFKLYAEYIMQNARLDEA